MRLAATSVLRLLSGVLLGLYLLTGTAAAAEAVLPTGDRLFWDDSVPGAGKRVRRALPEIRAQVARATGLPVPGPAEIHVVSGWDRMREVAGMMVPEWAAGVCVSGRGLIAVRSDVSDNPALLRSLESVMRHEWIHYAWSQASGPNRRKLPLWVEEGLAERVGGGFSADAGRQLDLAAEANRLIPFDQISSSWPRRQLDAALAYLQSKSWIEYFITHAGAQTLRAVLADTATPPKQVDSPPFEAAVFRHTKRPLSLWIEDWRAHAEQTAVPWYRWWLDDLFTTLMLIVGVVGGIAYFFIRARRRRQIAQMPDG